MNGLRLTLLIIGLVIIAGIYLWGTRATLFQKRLTRERRYADDETLDLGALPQETEEDLDYFPPLTDKEEPWLEDHEAGEIYLRGSEEHWERPRRTDTGEVRIIALYLVAPPDRPYSGDSIAYAAEMMGMQFGERGVFHHFGIGAMRSRKSLFCLANMFEPGIFDLDRMDEFETPGLVLFMPLPPPGDRQVAFELMLNTAQRLVKRLGGELLDDDREPLSADSIERLRTLVTNAGRGRGLTRP